MLQAAYRDGPFAWGPKCAKAAGFQPEPHARQSAHTEDEAQMPLQLTQPPEIQPGHKYRFQGQEVIACAPFNPLAGAWWVRPIRGEWLGDTLAAPVDLLTPLPMKYFHGVIPS